jgi:TetR/AcrR family transcriptional regulator, cholesterol catabolism regulator
MQKPRALSKSESADGQIQAPLNLRSDRPLMTIAASLFRRRGYRATTTRELGKELGIRGASLYHHINKKEDLLYAICLNSLSEIQSQTAHAIESESDPGRRVAALIEAHLGAAIADRDQHATMLFELRSLGPERFKEVVRRRAEYEKLVGTVIQDGQDAGLVRTDISARHLTLALLNLLNWSIFWYKPGGEISLTELTGLLTAVFMTGVTQRTGKHRSGTSAGRRRRTRPRPRIES